MVTLCVARPVNHARLAQQRGADEPLLIKARAPVSLLYLMSGNNATGCRGVHPGICGFYLQRTCVYGSVYVCPTEEEAERDRQLKIIGTNFINTAQPGKYG